MVNVECVTEELPFDGSGVTKWLGNDASDETKKERYEGGERDHCCIKGGEWAVVQSRQMGRSSVGGANGGGAVGCSWVG